MKNLPKMVLKHDPAQAISRRRCLHQGRSLLIVLILCLSLVPFAHAQQEMAQEQKGQLSLITATAEEGFALAIELARKGVTETQPDKDVLKKLRPAYSHDPDSLIAASQVVAIHFQTIAEANNYWRESE